MRDLRAEAILVQASFRIAVHILLRALVVAWSGLAGIVVAAPGADDGALPETRIRDLHYGDVLFHFFQDDYLESLVRLEASTDFGRLAGHAAEAELLSGGLYLSLGLHSEATRIFDRLLAESVPRGVADRARYYLALIGYQRGYPEQAWQNLQRISGPLSGSLEAQRLLLSANVLMALGRFGDAAEVLRHWPDDSVLAAYASFNLGVALVRSGFAVQGRTMLESVATMRASTEEERSLRDRANLALGYALLQEGDGSQAAIALSRVRLDGPYTNRALLGLGWAEADMAKPERALVPWLELRQRGLVDAAVQESYLAVPYAYAQLAANAQAVEQYRLAVDSYAAEVIRLDESIAAMRRGGFLDLVLQDAAEGAEIGWFWQLRSLPDAPETRYVYHLLASHEFQEGLKNYRDLRRMQSNLERLRASFEAFGDMIQARDELAPLRESRKQDLLRSTDLEQLSARQEELEQRLATIRDDRDVAAMATAIEASQRRSLQDLSARVASLPQGPQREALTERLRVLDGVLLWQLDAAYKLRLSRTERALGQTLVAVEEARDRVDLVRAAAIAAPRDTRSFSTRLDGLAERVEALEPRLVAAAKVQEQVLVELATGELEAQKRRLASYRSQAQFALATIYDGAAVGRIP